ncbi:MrgA [Bacillus methanolicus PB1]|uniref:MrgA n=1 Tax=Bacillus methanolicus PB1 TaxID=997296 RepID=I3E086_BACMT|nr:Dps family protein [Bacillus methanolicus]EIJ79907.1 MrgA [Bacillus methanolicus PB1]
MNLHSALNLQIANWNVLYNKLHRFHWYVKGPLFFTLHEKFEELYEEAAAVIDKVAERLLAIGGEPIATMKEYINTATLNETNGEKTANEMVQSLIQDYKQVKNDLKQLIKLAEENDDDVTVDLATGLMEKLDTHIWMLTAYLGD